MTWNKSTASTTESWSVNLKINFFFIFSPFIFIDYILYCLLLISKATLLGNEPSADSISDYNVLSSVSAVDRKFFCFNLSARLDSISSHEQKRPIFLQHTKHHFLVLRLNLMTLKDYYSRKHVIVFISMRHNHHGFSEFIQFPKNSHHQITIFFV